MPIIQKLITAYKIWQEFLPNFPKNSKSIPAKINWLFIEILEMIFIAGHSTKSKSAYLKKASIKLDLLKFFLQIIWEIKVLDNKKYIRISESLNEFGKMLGGWIKQTENKPSA